MKKILVITTNDPNSGVNKFRLLDPHIVLQKTYPNDFHIDFAEDKSIFDTQLVLKYDIVIYHAALQQIPQLSAQIEVIKKSNTRVIMDIDDYWEYHPSHPYYRIALSRNIKEIELAAFKNADVITTTTNLLANEIKRYNKNVFVIPNAINFEEKQFQFTGKSQSEFCRIGYVSGASHLEDIKLLRGLLTATKKDNVQFQLCGFNVKQEQANNSIWHKMEIEMTDNYNLDNPMYVDYLLEFSNIPHPSENKMLYKRVWSRPVNSYATLYDDLDICLAPLQNYKFNNMKSNLKLLEAGAKRTPIVISGIEPYLEGKHLVNCLAVEPKKEHKNWIKYVKMLINNPQLRDEISENLYNFVKENYDLVKISKLRKEFYDTL